MRTLAILLLVPLAACAWPGHARAAQNYDACTGTVASLPATISTPGTWCVKQDLATSIASGSAITVTANDVVLDCNDFGIDGSAAGISSLATGISASDTLHTEIRRCRVSGFSTGIALTTTGVGGGHRVEGNHLAANLLVGINVEGDGSRVQHNDVFATGSAAGAAGSLYGIRTAGSVDVLDNTVAGLVATTGGNGATIGIYTDFTGASTGSVSVDGNRVKGLHADGTGKATAVYLHSTNGRGAVRNNDLSGDGSTGSVGISCASATDRARYNIIDGFATFLVTCFNAGHNDEKH
ncbi:MAG TPA: hypothetical protein VGH80_00465 [Xanthomonadaceae bacterium]